MTRGAIRRYYPGTQLIDAAFPPDGWWLDFPGCGRYISLPTGNLKNLKQSEIDRAAQLGHGFMYFVEQSENTPINNTTDDDRALADQAVQMAVNFGVPDGVPFMFAVDTDGRPYMDQVRAAFITYRQRVPSNWPIGAYAGSDIIDQLISDGVIEYGHIPAALSWSSTSRPVDNVTVFVSYGIRWYKTPAASMFQHPSEAYRGGRIDRNDVIGTKPMPVWFPGDQVGPPLPDPGEIVLHGSPVNYIQCNAGVQGHHVDGSVYQCPVDGTVFRCLPSGLLQWVVSGDQWGTMNNVYDMDGSAKDYMWSTPVGDPDVFGLLTGAVPGRPNGWQDPHQVNVTTETVNVTQQTVNVDNDAIAVRVRAEFNRDPLK